MLFSLRHWDYCTILRHLMSFQGLTCPLFCVIPSLDDSTNQMSRKITFYDVSLLYLPCYWSVLTTIAVNLGRFRDFVNKRLDSFVRQWPFVVRSREGQSFLLGLKRMWLFWISLITSSVFNRDCEVNFDVTHSRQAKVVEFWVQTNYVKFSGIKSRVGCLEPCVQRMIFECRAKLPDYTWPGLAMHRFEKA